MQGCMRHGQSLGLPPSVFPSSTRPYRPVLSRYWSHRAQSTKISQIVYFLFPLDVDETGNRFFRMIPLILPERIVPPQDVIPACGLVNRRLAVLIRHAVALGRRWLAGLGLIPGRPACSAGDWPASLPETSLTDPGRSNWRPGSAPRRGSGAWHSWPR
jgi:hypothetical protein